MYFLSKGFFAFFEFPTLFPQEKPDRTAGPGSYRFPTETEVCMCVLVIALTYTLSVLFGAAAFRHRPSGVIIIVGMGASASP